MVRNPAAPHNLLLEPISTCVLSPRSIIPTSAMETITKPTTQRTTDTLRQALAFYEQVRAQIQKTALGVGGVDR